MTSFDLGSLETTTTVHWRDQFGRFLSELESAAEGTALEAAQEGAMLSASFAPRRSNALADSIRAYQISPGHAGWKAGTKAAGPQEFGARPHPIDSHDGGPLANKEQGFYAPSGHVEHPGNPATRFMEAARDIVKANLKDKLKRHWSK